MLGGWSSEARLLMCIDMGLADWHWTVLTICTIAL